MKQKLSLEQASENFKGNVLCRKGITPFSLITNGIITYNDWLNALRDYPRTEDEHLCEDGHNTQESAFGYKVKSFLNVLGFDSYQFSKSFKNRSNDHELESIKLIHIKLSAIYHGDTDIE